MITLATLEQATPQEVFDQVKNHLLKQNARSGVLGERWKCKYRGLDGLKCAAGCLISDEEYKPKMESRTWYGLIYNGLIKETQHDVLIKKLQIIHDDTDVENWEKDLKELAKEHGLEYEV